MKRKSLLWILITISCLSVFACSSAENTALGQKIIESIFHLAEAKTIPVKTSTIKDNAQLPAALVLIEEEAFSGTAFQIVDLPEQVEAIGQRAFADNSKLVSVSIPDATRHISEDAFTGSSRHLSIKASTKSYARTWADENRIPFNPIACLCASESVIRTADWANGKAGLMKDAPEAGRTEAKQAKPTGRLAGELKAARYDCYSAFHIEGRSPPVRV